MLQGAEPGTLQEKRIQLLLLKTQKKRRKKHGHTVGRKLYCQYT